MGLNFGRGKDKNYKYPNLTLPKSEMLPSFEHYFNTTRFDAYYSQEKLRNC